MPFATARRVVALLLPLLLLPAVGAQAAVTVTGQARAEGDRVVAFVLSSDRPLVGDSVAITTRDGSAKAGQDFEAQDEPVVRVPGGGDGVVVEVPVADDAVAEADEAFVLVVEPVGGVPVEATGTIRNDDAPPLHVVAPALAEGGAGSIVVGLVVPTTQEVVAVVRTADGTATAGQDLDAVDATVTFAPGERLKEVPLRTTQDDGTFEGDESFALLVGATGAEAVRTRVPVTIEEDDPPPTLSMEGAPPVAEGDAPGAVTGARLTLSRAAAVPVVVKVGTFGASATSGEDFVPVLGELTFRPGDVDAVQLVEVKADTTIEKDERFRLIAAAGSNVVVPGDAFVVDLTIRNDDRDTSAPALVVRGVELRRGVLSASVACPASEARCSGRVTFFKDADRRARDDRLRPELRLGQVRFRVAGGTSRLVRLRLRAPDRALLRRVASARVSAYAVGADAAGNQATARRAARVSTR